jgi:hypothetical protein
MRPNLRILGICHLAAGATRALEMRETSNDGLAALPEMIDRRALDRFTEVQRTADPFDTALARLTEEADRLSRSVTLRVRILNEFPGIDRGGFAKWHASQKGTPNSSKHGHKKANGAFGKSRHPRK